MKDNNKHMVLVENLIDAIDNSYSSISHVLECINSILLCIQDSSNEYYSGVMYKYKLNLLNLRINLCRILEYIDEVDAEFRDDYQLRRGLLLDEDFELISDKDY